MQNKIHSAYPPPPPYYKQYGTPETMLKPPTPIVGEYRVFHTIHDTVIRKSIYE